MKPMRFSLRVAPAQRVDLSPLTPARLAGLDLPAIERLAINTTRAPLVVGDLFRVRAGDPANLVIEGGSERFDQVGAGMDGGALLLEGDAGQGAGRGMRAGTLEIAGDAGGWAASGLRGGSITVGGDAGEFLGGPMAGERAGMAGGVVLLRGSAGPRAGDRMRRGLLVIEGAAGAYPGSRMIAGTIVVCGTSGALPGYLMRRGTLVLNAAMLGPTFVQTGMAEPVFTRLLARALAPLSRRAARLVGAAGSRFAGDMAVMGKGEAFLAG